MRFSSLCFMVLGMTACISGRRLRHCITVNGKDACCPDWLVLSQTANVCECAEDCAHASCGLGPNYEGDLERCNSAVAPSRDAAALSVTFYVRTTESGMVGWWDLLDSRVHAVPQYLEYGGSLFPQHIQAGMALQLDGCPYVTFACLLYFSLYECPGCEHTAGSGFRELAKSNGWQQVPSCDMKFTTGAATGKQHRLVTYAIRVPYGQVAPADYVFPVVLFGFYTVQVNRGCGDATEQECNTLQYDARCTWNAADQRCEIGYHTCPASGFTGAVPPLVCDPCPLDEVRTLAA